MTQTLKETILKMRENKDEMPPVQNILSVDDLKRQFESILDHFDIHLSESIIRSYNELLKERHNSHYMAILNGYTNLLLLERDRAIANSKTKKQTVVKFED